MSSSICLILASKVGRRISSSFASNVGAKMFSAKISRALSADRKD